MRLATLLEAIRLQFSKHLCVFMNLLLFMTTNFRAIKICAANSLIITISLLRFVEYEVFRVSLYASLGVS